jgi:antitoxin component YwqK of YwqJK toxin-antitoxin module
VIEYYPNGHPRTQAGFVADLMEGDFIEFDHKGRETHRQTFAAGKPIGPKYEKASFGRLKEIEPAPDTAPSEKG